MTKQEFAQIMSRLEDFYQNFYAGRNKQKVFDSWYPLFKSDDAVEVEQAVVICICSLKFPPAVADIKLQMAENRIENQPTAMQAFQMISKAVKKSYDKKSATEAYNALPPMIRNVAGDPVQLLDWHNISFESFQTVIMSAIRESYNTLAKREAKYYCLPVGVQKSQAWRLDAPEQEALPEPQKIESHEEVMDRLDRQNREYRKDHGMEANPEYEDKVAKFLTPMTKNELLEFEAKKRHEEKKRMNSWQ